jgi:hypothetical protein
MRAHSSITSWVRAAPRFYEASRISLGGGHWLAPSERIKEPLAQEPDNQLGEAVARRAVAPFGDRHILRFILGVSFLPPLLVDERLAKKRHPGAAIRVDVDRAIE